MARSVQEIARKGRSTWAMDVSCPKCAHRLWAEKVSVAEHFDVWAFFDDEEPSDTHAKRVGLCPECGAWLTQGAGWPTSGVREGHQKSNVDH
jgi:ssDNA-binding Zn-finger/Zn-ribbon topoisomerase 1